MEHSNNNHKHQDKMADDRTTNKDAKKTDNHEMKKANGEPASKPAHSDTR